MKPFILLLALLLIFSCKNNEKPRGKKITIPNYEKLALLDVPLGEIKDGDWLQQHLEAGQTFQQYLAKKPVTVSEDHNVIYLQPIGTFTQEQQKVMDLNSEYIGLFFGLKTIVLEPINEDEIPKENKRIQFETEQLDASYIIDEILKGVMPNDGIAMMALTAKDLYPRPDWNFVFGLASYSKRMGVTSIFRFSDTELTSQNYSQCLNRLIKTSTHEIGHMFTIAHCTHASCLMNGSNHLVELDSRPNALCSVCLAKLSWNLNFDNVMRLEKLISFCKKHKLDSDALVLQKQLEAIK
ncbi:MAG: Zn-dependent protease [Flavobacteriales bacterium]|nr:Zn-dependent protease [Flavobacteriales bacterium]